MNNQPIQFLLHQLATNEQDRQRFNQNIFTIECEIIKNKCYFRQKTTWVIFHDDFKLFNIFLKIQIIRTCLSRVNGKAVLRVFEGWSGEDLEQEIWVVSRQQIQVTDYLSLAFDEPLRNGKPLDEALQALHDIMLDLVPEYVEFCKNNK